MSGEVPTRAGPGPKQVTGIVTSAKMQKTRAVQVVRLERHEKYGKFMRKHTTFKVHDEKEVSREGDTVLIVETRPISKTKRWRLIEVIEKSRYGGALAVPGAEDSADTSRSRDASASREARDDASGPREAQDDDSASREAPDDDSASREARDGAPDDDSGSSEARDDDSASREARDGAEESSSPSAETDGEEGGSR